MFKMMSQVVKMIDDMFRAYDEAYLEAVRCGYLSCCSGCNVEMMY